MSSVIRVMLADDSSIVRRLVSDVIQAHPDCDVVYQAKNGLDVLDQIKIECPDVLVLDVEMPVLDGIQTVLRLRETDPHLPIVMCSSATARGRRGTVQALCHGASDYVVKPVGAGHVHEAVGKLQQDLLPKVVAWGSRHLEQECSVDDFDDAITQVGAKQATSRGIRSSRPRHPVDAVVFDVPKGGLSSLVHLVQSLPSDLEVPIIVSQPLPGSYADEITEQLGQLSPVPIATVSDQETLTPGTVWIAPGDQFATVRLRDTALVAQLTDTPPKQPDELAVDVLLRSVAETLGKHALAIILAGAESVSHVGCQELRNAGAQVFAQDDTTRSLAETSSILRDAGWVDAILPLSELPKEILQHLRLNPHAAKCL